MEADTSSSSASDSTSPCGEVPTFTTLDEALDARDAGVEVDDMDLRRLALKGQGSLESEFCFGEESSLRTAFKSCRKNPGHEGFIPMDDLRLDHLPEDIRQPSVLRLIQCQGVLTVKVKTFYTSVKRPDPCQARGRKIGQRATGFVLWAMPLGFTIDKERCLRNERPSKIASEDTAYMLRIFTAAHVVFDQSEADEVEIEFSYFNESGGKIVETLKGSAKYTKFGGDFSELTFFTHDRELYTKMRLNLDEMHELELIRDQCQWLIIVSYPHNQGKHVSFGKLENDGKSIIEESSGIIHLEREPIRYSTPTCPGSSGARICLPLTRMFHQLFAHSGRFDDNFNVSSPGYYMHDLNLWLGHEIDLETKSRSDPPGRFDWGFRFDPHLPEMSDPVPLNRKRTKIGTYRALLCCLFLWL